MAHAFAPPESYDVGRRPADLVAADLDRDGRVDLVVTTEGDRSVEVLLGRADGTFVVTSLVDAGLDPVAAAVADVDGDGMLDVVVTGERAGDLAWLRGDGHGNLVPSGSVAVGRSPGAIAAGDLDQDGRPEFVVALGRDDAVAVVRWSTGAGLERVATYAVGRVPVAVALSDVDRDGRLDAVVACYGDDTVVVLEGDGAMGLGPATVHAVGRDPSDLLIVDVDNDRLADVVVPNRGDDTLSVLAGLPAGGLASSSTLAAGRDPEQVLQGDFDGDCVLDLLVVSSAGTDVSVLPGTGASYGPPRALPVGSHPGVAVHADLDRDLRFDLAWLDRTANLVRITRGDSVARCDRFEVRRDLDASALDGSIVHALTTSSPYDDQAPALDPGEVLFYRVEHTGGIEVRTSAARNDASGAVRLGFADGAVDPSAVDLLASKTSIPGGSVVADGVTPIVVTLVPRDSSGVPLGSGLDVTAEVGGSASVGIVVDLSNGGYRVSVVADAAPVDLYWTVDTVPLDPVVLLFFAL